MSKLLNEEYHNLGTNDIKKELWLNVQMDQLYKNYIKPYGGLWTSHLNNYSISDWISYKKEKNDLDELDSIRYLNSCLVKFKKDSKFISLENNNDYKNLKDSGFVYKLDTPLKLNTWYTKTIDELIDYEKISNYYDLIYINPISNTTLSNYSINTMYALNPSCIEYYKPITIDIDKNKILTIGTKKNIKEPTKEYYDLINTIKIMFQKQIICTNYNEYINKLYELSKSIEQTLLNDIDNIDYPILDKKRLINIIIRNIYREEYLKTKKLLLKK